MISLLSLQTGLQAAPPAMPPGDVALPHDIRSFLLYPSWIADNPLVIGSLVVLVLFATALIVWFFRRGKVVKPEPPKDPWDVLRDQIRVLNPGEPFVQEKQRQFYFDLSHLVRLVIERRTGIRATDLTVKELRMPVATRVPLPVAEQSALLKFLEHADMVKFADKRSTLEEAERFKRQAMTWYEALRPLSIHVEATKPDNKQANLDQLWARN